MTENKLEHKTPTKQGGRKPTVSPLNGVPTPPGFEAHPERRHNGAWKKTETARWKFEQIIKMDSTELQELIANEKAAEFERTCATIIYRARTMAAKSESPADLDRVLNMLERLANQIYGQPKQMVEQTNIELKPILPEEK